MKHYWISLSYATYMVSSKDGIIVNAAPIASWMIGKPLEQVKSWLFKKNARIEEMED